MSIDYPNQEILPDEIPNNELPDIFNEGEIPSPIDSRRIQWIQKLKTSQVEFVVAGTDNIIATINASVEGLNIDADKINISGSTTFASGYDPNEKLDLLGGSYDSAASGARVRIFPDTNTGIQIIDDVGNDVFKALVGGVDVGDVIIGDYAGGQGILYDKSENSTTFAGILSAPSGTLGTITAGTLTGTIITGGTIQTSVSGNRIEIKNNILKGWDGSSDWITLDPTGESYNSKITVFSEGAEKALIIAQSDNTTADLIDIQVEGTGSTGGVIKIFGNNASTKEFLYVGNFTCGKGFYYVGGSETGKVSFDIRQLDLDKNALHISNREIFFEGSNDGLVDFEDSATGSDLKSVLHLSAWQNHPHFWLEGQPTITTSTSSQGCLWFDGTDLKINVTGTIYKFNKTAV